MKYADGREYTLEGSPTGITYGQAPLGKFIYDGTTDGEFHYAVTPVNNVSTVLRFDGSWEN